MTQGYAHYGIIYNIDRSYLKSTSMNAINNYTFKYENNGKITRENIKRSFQIRQTAALCYDDIHKKKWKYGYI